jgi:hypothetical protein
MEIDSNRLKQLQGGGRMLASAEAGDQELGPLKLLPGVWKNEGGLEGRGWNAIALPFETRPGSPLDYRLMLNQYNETLVFDLVSKGVPNRGLTIARTQADQVLSALDYQQTTDQIAVTDFPESDPATRGPVVGPGNTIHHEPGLFLHLINEVTEGLDIARLSSIPHGNSVLALGKSVTETPGAPVIPDVNGLPLKFVQDLNHPYLAPYKHFHVNPFLGLFDPTRPAQLLKEANEGVDIVRTTTLDLDTELLSGGIHNIPFIVRQADTTAMRSIFWIQELAETDASGKPQLRLQYLQIVMLDFDPRTTGLPGRIVWPHISINTMHKVAEAPEARLAAVAR